MPNRNIIFAMIVRYLYSWRHNLDRLADSFYWPAMELFIWGLTSLYVARAAQNIPHIVPIILTGIVFWMVTWREQYEITTNILAEIWDKNLVNIFASPIRVREWIITVLINGIIRMIIQVAFASILAFFLYSFNIFAYGLLLVPFIFSLLLTGWFAGFIVAGLIIRIGPTIQTLAWVGVMILAPFSALYYPVSVLPFWAQKVAAFVPASYIFEGMREILFTGSLSYDKLLISFALNTVYLVLSIWFFVFMFNQSRKLGLGRLI